MNGQVTKVKGSGKKQIEPGCEIIVPSKAKKKTNMGKYLRVMLLHLALWE